MTGEASWDPRVPLSDLITQAIGEQPPCQVVQQAAGDENAEFALVSGILNALQFRSAVQSMTSSTIAPSGAVLRDPRLCRVLKRHSSLFRVPAS